MANILPPAPVDAPFGSYGWQDWYIKVRKAINDGATVLWSSITGLPTTLAGYGITDAGSGTYMPVITNAGGFSAPVVPTGAWTYYRIENTIRVTGQVVARSSPSTNAGFDFTLPIETFVGSGAGLGIKADVAGAHLIQFVYYVGTGGNPSYGYVDQVAGNGFVSDTWTVDFQYSLV